MSEAVRTIALIGSGAMGEAIIGGLLRTGLTTAEHILASGPRAERGEELKKNTAFSLTWITMPRRARRTWWCFRSSRRSSSASWPV